MQVTRRHVMYQRHNPSKIPFNQKSSEVEDPKPEILNPVAENLSHR